VLFRSLISHPPTRGAEKRVAGYPLHPQEIVTAKALGDEEDIRRLVFLLLE
jgi:hypothetical protein